MFSTFPLFRMICIAIGGTVCLLILVAIAALVFVFLFKLWHITLGVLTILFAGFCFAEFLEWVEEKRWERIRNRVHKRYMKKVNGIS